MIVQEKQGNINTTIVGSRTIDLLPIEWHEANKRILHKKTASGVAIAIKFLQTNPELTEGDILYSDEKNIIAVSIIECDAIVIKPSTTLDVASICYEIGNKHLPLFFQDDELLVPNDIPLYRLLEKSGFNISIEKRKLLKPLKTTVSPHGHSSSETLFSRIMKITQS